MISEHWTLLIWLALQMTRGSFIPKPSPFKRCHLFCNKWHHLQQVASFGGALILRDKQGDVMVITAYLSSVLSFKGCVRWLYFIFGIVQWQICGNKMVKISDLLHEEHVNLACFMETWLCESDEVTLIQVTPAVYNIRYHPWLEGWDRVAFLFCKHFCTTRYMGSSTD